MIKLKEILKENTSKSEMLRALQDIRAWVVDEQNPKKYQGLIDNIDYAIKLAKKL